MSHRLQMRLWSWLVLGAVCLGGAAPSAARDVSSEAAPIPGPRTCFWYRGPVSGDPYINVAYPDSHTFYWSATFTVPDGARLSIDGQFAHARYQSFISYDERGRPVEALADYLIAPQAGSINPFLAGADRDARNRAYRIDVISSGEDLERREGRTLANEQRNSLHTPPYGPQQQTILYRIYAPDAAHPVTGGVPLPEPVLTLRDGRELRGDAACAALNTQQALVLDAAALSIPLPLYHQLTHQPGRPDTWPATPDPSWHIQLDRAALLGIYTGQIDPNARRSEGGFYPNPDNNYIRTVINLRHGPVLVLRGRMPTTPRTLRGDRRMGGGQLRYWSICSNQSFANTRVTDCLFDEQVPVDAQGNYTIVISKAGDRPRNANARCGLAWLPVAEDGDGAGDPDVAVIQIRNMLAAPDFAEAIQNVDVDGRIGEVMGPYLPQARYMMPNMVETLFACPL